MNNQEWIEYYRFHPSEFDGFIKYVESEFAKKDSRIVELKAVLSTAIIHIERMNETATPQATMPGSELVYLESLLAETE